MARKTSFPRLSADQAHAALRWLHAVGKVKSSEILTALKRREALAAEIRARLEQLGGEGLRFLRGPEGLQRRAPRKGKRVSAARRAAWRVQGRYLAAVRPLSKAGRAKVKSIREESGVRAAVAAARRLASKA